MSNQKVRVAVNGYGVIGKRVAYAVALQDDMELAGVADVVYDYRIRVAAESGYPIYSATDEKRGEMEAAGIPVAGTLEDLFGRADVVVDCAPKKIAALNKKKYQKAGVKAIFQGGEKHELTGYSFVGQVNYEGAINRDLVRVVSCNTTALSRVLHALNKRKWIKRACAVILRRGTDPWESHSTGMINTVIPETKVPSTRGRMFRPSLRGWISPPWRAPDPTTSAIYTSPWLKRRGKSSSKICAMPFGKSPG
jgi:glyceraldehyde-3-phosphate dehydrogenase (NAD(P))